VVGEVKGVDELGVRVVCRGARCREDRRSEIEIDPKRRGLRHSVTTKPYGALTFPVYFLFQWQLCCCESATRWMLRGR